MYVLLLLLTLTLINCQELVNLREDEQNKNFQTQIKNPTFPKKGQIYINNMQINQMYQNQHGVIVLDQLDFLKKQNQESNPYEIKCSDDIKLDIGIKQKYQQIYTNQILQLTIRFSKGYTKAYLVPTDFTFLQGSAQQRLQSSMNVEQQANNNQQLQKKIQQSYLYNYRKVQLSDGLNMIKVSEISSIFQQRKDLVLYIVTQEQSQIIFRVGQPIYQINGLVQQEEISIQVQPNQIYGKLLEFQMKQNFMIQFSRFQGFPLIQIYECYQEDGQCYRNPKQIPIIQQNSKSTKIYELDGMMNKQQEFLGNTCQNKDNDNNIKKCVFYLSIVCRAGATVALNILLTKKNKLLQLQQNLSLTQDLSAQAIKKYKFETLNRQKSLLYINILQGKLNYIVQQYSSLNSQIQNYQDVFKKKNASGLNQVQIPKTNSVDPDLQRSFLITVQAIQIDCTYTILFSQGEPEIFLNDGQTFSYQLTYRKNLTLQYKNIEQVMKPFYFSVSVVPSSGVRYLCIQIYEKNKEGQKKLIQKHPNKDLQNSESQTKKIEKNQQVYLSSLLFQIPGNKDQLQFFVYLSKNQHKDQQIRDINATFNIVDTQIINLPLSTPISVQVDKDKGVDFMVSNNQQGFIELIVTRCDDTDPSIAYSSDSYEFLKKIYDYQSPLQGQNQRIIKNNIRVRKGNSLYIHIGGDQIQNSFIQITADYMQKSRNKLQKVEKIKAGDHGNLEYQLLTNSKVQVTFEGLQCQQKCREQTIYEYVWSNKRSQLFRNLYCPNSHIISQNQSLTQQILSESYPLSVKPAIADNQISFQHVLKSSIIFMGIRATYKPKNKIIYYKDIEIVTISGQIGRMSTNFIIFLAVGIFSVLIFCVFVIEKATFRGYRRIRIKK